MEIQLKTNRIYLLGQTVDQVLGQVIAPVLGESVSPPARQPGGQVQRTRALGKPDPVAGQAG